MKVADAGYHGCSHEHPLHIRHSYNRLSSSTSFFYAACAMSREARSRQFEGISAPMNEDGDPMFEIAMIAIGVGLFALAALYIAACERL